jgi:hypothetical protein
MGEKCRRHHSLFGPPDDVISYPVIHAQMRARVSTIMGRRRVIRRKDAENVF